MSEQHEDTKRSDSAIPARRRRPIAIAVAAAGEGDGSEAVYAVADDGTAWMGFWKHPTTSEPSGTFIWNRLPDLPRE